MKISTADKWLSRYIRLRDAWESNGVLLNRCATSGKIQECKQLECGHYMSRRHTSTRWSELNALPQSTYENRWKYGNPEKMAQVLDEKFGKGTADKVKIMTRQVTKVDEKLITLYYKEAVNELLKSKGWEKLKWW